jgi:hypothetical protein
MAVSNLGRLRTWSWIPPGVTAIYKITVERSDGTVDDVTEIIDSMEITDGTTDSMIGDFKVNIWNPNGTYTDVYSGNEIFRFYMDYATSATTLRFRGRVEKPNKEGLRIVLEGKGEIAQYSERKVTANFSSQDCSDIFKSLVATYAPGTTTTGIQTSNTSITVSWYEKPLQECILELCTAASFDAYLSANLDWKFLAVGSRHNQSEGIVHDLNLLYPGFTFGPDLSQIRNRVRVFGAEIDGVQIIYTANDKVSQEETYGTPARPYIKTEIIRDDNVSTRDQAVELANFNLDRLKNPPNIGEATSITLLASLQPADSIWMSDPDNGLAPGIYRVIQHKHEIDVGGGAGLTTKVSVNKEPRKIYHVLRSIIENANKNQGTQVNPQDMDFSFDDRFNSDSGSHSNTEITNGVLRLQEGESSGVWTSGTRTEAKNINTAYLIVNGTKLTAATYRVTATNGASYDAILNKGDSAVTLSVPGGGLKLEITITDTETEIDSFSLQYSRDES